MQESVLKVKNLRTYFFTRLGVIKAVDGISFNIKKGETIGIAGESGCGKSVTCLSIMGALPKSARIMNGSGIIFENENLVKKTEKQLLGLRGKKISIVLQDPHNSLNPVFTLGSQIKEAYRMSGLKGKIVKEKAIEILNRVNVIPAEEKMRKYPYQCSGGIKQRLSIAIAMAQQPKILIADEPTSALDVTTQKKIMSLLKGFQKNNNMAILLVTHDLSLISKNCDSVIIMWGGKIVERGRVERVFEKPAHPYTKMLINSISKFG